MGSSVRMVFTKDTTVTIGVGAGPMACDTVCAPGMTLKQSGTLQGYLSHEEMAGVRGDDPVWITNS